MSLVLRNRLLGVAFIVVLAALLMLTVAIYNKTFVSIVPVTLNADRAGNQMTPQSDVKIRGIIVGEVREINSTGDGAVLKLALQPDKTEMIPKNVQARLIPKTLFGEKYVALIIPDDAQGSISEGDVITQDRSATAIEVGKVLNDLLPLIKAVRPVELNQTLAAVSTALEGRGDPLGDNLANLNDYLVRFNPNLPALQQDMAGVADLSDSLNDAAPGLLEVLDNTAFSQRSVVDYQSDLAAFLVGTQQFADTANRVLTANEQNLIALGRVSRPVLSLYAQYAPELPCLAKGLADSETALEQVFGGEQGPFLHITLEVVKDQGAYTQADLPQSSASGGPDCHGLPDPRTNPDQFGPAGAGQDNPFDPNAEGGVTPDQYPDGSGALSCDGTPGCRQPSAAGASSASPAQIALLPFSRSAGASSPQENDLMRTLLAPAMGVTASQVPDVAALLFGPLARGSVVDWQVSS